MNPTELKERLEKLCPEAQVIVEDLTGTQDHYRVVVTASIFQGVPTLKRHQMVMDLVMDELNSGDLHALSIETKV